MTDKTPARQILTIEDDQTLARMLCDQVARLGHVGRSASSLAQGRLLAQETPPDLMLVDVRLPDGDGFEVLEEFGDHCPVIFLTAFGAVDQAVTAVRAGATDYLVKPVSAHTLELAIRKAFTTRELERDLRYWRKQADRRPQTTMIGDSPEAARMRDTIALYAAADSPVLIRGETGVGKETVGRFIHESSARGGGRFLALDCDAVEETVLASELFGKERAAAAAGDDSGREGVLELAEGGTIYLNEISDLSPSLQGRLLRVMESGVFRRVGGAVDLRADIRIIAATRRDLGALVAQGAFRSELYYRLNAFVLNVPALRERPHDIPELARHFLDARSFNRDLEKTLSDSAIRAMTAYDWPGNLRELRNAVERGLIMSGREREILSGHLSLPGGPGRDSAVELCYDAPPTLERLRDDYLKLLLERHEGNRAQVARIMGVSERNTYRLVRKLLGSERSG